MTMNKKEIVIFSFSFVSKIRCKFPIDKRILIAEWSIDYMRLNACQRPNKHTMRHHRQRHATVSVCQIAYIIRLSGRELMGPIGSHRWMDGWMDGMAATMSAFLLLHFDSTLLLNVCVRYCCCFVGDASRRVPTHKIVNRSTQM